MILRFFYFFYHDYKKWLLIILMLLYFYDHCIMKTGSPRLRGDDKLFTTVTPAQAEVQDI